MVLAGQLMLPYTEFIEPTRLPEKPTSHRPGSLGKVLEMAARLERGEHLYHEHDCKLMLPDTGGRHHSVTMSRIAESTRTHA